MKKNDLISIFDKLKSKKIGILMGGQNEEREVSLRSGDNVYRTLNDLGLNCFKIDVGPSIVSDLEKEKIDIAYNILHGTFGEDGKIQGLLESMAIPYTGENVLASAGAFNKVFTKDILLANKIPTPDFLRITNFQNNLTVAVDKLSLPMICKPEESGSSWGVDIIENESELKQKLIDISRIDQNVSYFLEKFIKGTEITVGIFDFNATLEVLPILELRPKNKFYDYEAKYTKGMTEMICPAELNDSLTNKINEMTREIYKIFNFQSCVRVDFIIDAENNPYVLEINTQPGMTDTSDIPHMAQKAGYDFSDVLLINLAKCL